MWHSPCPQHVTVESPASRFMNGLYSSLIVVQLARILKEMENVGQEVRAGDMLIE